MILEKMTANIGCITPLIMAQMSPTKMYGHSVRLRRNTLTNDTGGIFSSCREGGEMLSQTHNTPTTVALHSVSSVKIQC